MSEQPDLAQRSTDAETAGKIDVLAWLDKVFPILEGSSWATALQVQGVSVLEICRAPLYLGLLKLLQKSGASAIAKGEQIAPVLDNLHKRVWNSLLWRFYKLSAERRALSQASVLSPTTVVFWPRELTHIQSQLPVAAALKNLGTSFAFLACQPKIVRRLAEKGVQSAYAIKVWPNARVAGFRHGHRLAQTLATAPEVSLPEFPTLVEQQKLLLIFGSIISNLLPKVCESLEFARLLLAKKTTRVLVVGNDLTVEGRAASMFAKDNGVSTACLMHGSISGEPLHGYHCVDRLIVYGNDAKRELIQQGVLGERLAVCGAPYLDDQPHQSGQPHPVVHAHLGLAAERPYVLVATSGPGHSISHDHHRCVIENLMRLSAQTPALFVAKLHRKDSEFYYKEVRQLVPESRLVVTPDLPNLTIFDWLQGCDLVLTGASSTAVEAMLMDVPVISMDFANEIKQVNFIDAGATWHVRTEEDLGEAVRTLLYDPVRRAALAQKAGEFLKNQFYALDGRSAQRSAEILLALP